MKRIVVAALTALFVLTLATSALAAVTFDSQTGTGFVGKGDVQTVYGWNNKTLQDNAGSVRFQFSSTTSTSWNCTKEHPGQGQEQPDIVQERSTTTTTQGFVTTAGRDRNQITGFILQGYASGAASTSSDGPAVGTCPARPSGFVFDEASVETTVTGGGLQVSIDGINWFSLP